MNVIEKYEAEIANDAAVDELNVKDVAMRLPAIKHKWVSRLINHKRQKYKLECEREKIIEESAKKLKERADIQLSLRAVKTQIQNTTSVKDLSDSIEEQVMIIDYLEHVESIFRYMTNDIKNVIEIMKLELT